MKNVEMTVKGNILTLKVDLTQEFGLSSSGKTTLVASASEKVDGHDGMKFGLNVYKK